ncbi:6396_t:CDS:1 [Ambispora gerdemannii]|uniref:6396_t:CDS:1 n=1 Tax=Ambispora gerdemannii TaxID=144530 RepID=A0A9N9AYB2_9GLOM|nr:6396_t:CDS:1 [Ambispora gerdemannii]
MINTGLDLTAENTNNTNRLCSSLPTHSVFLAAQQQEQHERLRKRHIINHLRSPPAFDTYLHPRSSSSSSSDSGSRRNSVAEEMLNNPSAYTYRHHSRTSSQSSENELIVETFGKVIRRVSSAIRANLMEGIIENVDFDKVNSREEEWESDFEESSSESEEEFIMGSPSQTPQRRHSRTPSYNGDDEKSLSSSAPTSNYLQIYNSRRAF